MNQDGTLIAIGRYIASIARSSENATPSNQPLEDIHHPVNFHKGLAKTLGGFNELIDAFTESIDGRRVVESGYIDPDDEAIKTIKSATLSLQAFLTKLVNKKFSMNKDTSCELLHDAYSETIATAASLAEALDDARLKIIKHDLAAEPRMKIV